MTLCQHGVQTDAGYECSACVTSPVVTRAGHAEATAAAETLRAYLEDLADRLLQHEESVIFDALNTVEQYLRSER